MIVALIVLNTTNHVAVRDPITEESAALRGSGGQKAQQFAVSESYQRDDKKAVTVQYRLLSGGYWKVEGR